MDSYLGLTHLTNLVYDADAGIDFVRLLVDDVGHLS